MGLWKKFVAWLFSPTRRTAARAVDAPIDVDESTIADELQLLQEARRLGEAGQPAPNSTLPAGIEAQIVQRIDMARLNLVEWAAGRLAIFNADLARLDTTATVDNALQADQEFTRKADALLNEQAPLLNSLGDKARRARGELTEFREKNGLTRNARFPEGTGKALRISGLLLFIVVEAILNASLFAIGMDEGLIGGFLYAATFAFANVIAAFLLGRYVIRNIFHRSLLLKLAGSMALVLAVLTMLTISLTVAHYRDALVSDIQNPSKVAWQALSHAPFMLGDVNSWLLMGLSLLFAVGALIDGLSLDDLYPGYGRLARDCAAAETDYQGEIDGLREGLEELKDEMLRELEDDTRSVQALIVRQEGLLEQKSKTQLRLQGSLFNAQRCMEALVTRFRTENALHRKGIPVPPSFSVMHVLADIRQPDFRMDEGETALAAQQARLQELLGKVQHVKAAIQAGFNKKFDSLVALEELVDAAQPPSERVLRAVA
ncbi:hypothetical protein [Paraburkholderia sp. 40]|uniref:hypothetical protein n=1 Tax=Paraburkholderia sp. 40 TaxID=2991059 RepID=UPI003D1B55DF